MHHHESCQVANTCGDICRALVNTCYKRDEVNRTKAMFEAIEMRLGIRSTETPGCLMYLNHWKCFLRYMRARQTKWREFGSSTLTRR